MALREFIIDNFSGGYRSPRTAKFAPNESTQIHHAFCDTGSLYVTPGRRLLNGQPIVPGQPVGSIYVYQHAGNSYVFAHCNRTVWLGREYRIPIAWDNGTTIAAASGYSFDGWPDRGTFLINDTEIVSYSYRSATQLRGLSQHTLASAGSIASCCDFRPCFSKAGNKNTTNYIWDRYPVRVSGDPDYLVHENFCQVGQNLYLSSTYYDPQVFNQTLKWYGFVYMAGKVKCLSGTPTTVTGDLSGYTTNFVTAGVRRGDIIFIKNGGSWFSSGTTVVHGRTIRKVDSETQLTLESAYPFSTANRGINENNEPIDYVDYIIVRVHPIGVLPASSVSASKTAGTGFAVGTHMLRWRYANSLSGYSGNISSPATVRINTASIGKIVLSGWGTYPTASDIDRIQIYHSRDGATYHRLTEISSGTGTTRFPASITLTGTASITTEVLEADASNHMQPPGGLGPLVLFNDRLYAHMRWRNNHMLYFSSLGAYEYWPLHQFGLDDPDSFQKTEGGYVRVGSDSSEPIMAIVPEGGAYSETGRTGTNLLIFTPSRAFRWFGFDWSDFKLDEAFHSGLASRRCVNNIGGIIYWLSPDGPMRVASGSAVPQQIYKKLFPRGINEIMWREPRGPYLNQWAGMAWQGKWIVLRCSGYDTTARRIMVYDTEADCWTDYCGVDSTAMADIGSLAQWRNTANHVGVLLDPTRILAGSSNDGYVWELFRNTGQSSTTDFGRFCYWKPKGFESLSTPQGVQFSWLSAPLYLSAEPAEVMKVKQIRRVVAAWRGAPDAQSVELRIYRNGNLATPIYTEAATIPAVPAEYYTHVTTTWYPSAGASQDAHGCFFNIMLRGTFTRQVELQWVAISYVVHDSAIGTGLE